MRVGSIHTGNSRTAAGPAALWLRRLLSILVLAASMAALALIVGDQGDPLVHESQARPAEVSPAAAAAPADAPKPATALTAEEASRYRALSDYVARRYRVSQEVAFELVALAHQAGRQRQLDPLLIIAVISVESSFNPIAESVAGAKGLMQIIPKYHGEKLQPHGGEQVVFDPAINIQVGAQILREYLRLTGNLGSALQMYAGALGDPEDQYTHRVLAMKQRLQQVVAQSARSAQAAAPLRTASARNSGGFGSPLD